MTKARFIARSNAFCDGSRVYIKEHSTAYRREQPPGTPKGKLFAGEASGFILPTLQFWYDDIISLRRPPGDKAQIQDILSTVQLTVANSMKRQIHSARQLSTMFSRSNRLMGQYGIDRCIVSKAFPYD